MAAKKSLLSQESTTTGALFYSVHQILLCSNHWHDVQTTKCVHVSAAQITGKMCKLQNFVHVSASQITAKKYPLQSLLGMSFFALSHVGPAPCEVAANRSTGRSYASRLADGPQGKAPEATGQSRWGRRQPASGRVAGVGFAICQWKQR